MASGINVLDHLDRFNISNPIPTPFQSFLRLAGSPTGDHNVVANHSAAQATYSWICPAGYIAFVYQLVSYLQDGAVAWAVGDFAGGTALTVGLKFRVVRSGVPNDLLDNVPIKSNGDISMHVHNIEYHDWLATTTALSALVQFDNGGAPLQVNGLDSFEMLVKDDFRTMDTHTHKLTGHLYQIDEDGIQPPVP